MAGVFVCGTSGSGKTYWAARRFKMLPSAYAAVFVNTQFEQYFSGCEIVHRFPNMPERGSHVVWEIENPDELEEWLGSLFRHLRKVKRAFYTYIFVDEADIYARRYSISFNIRAIATRGRRYNVVPVWITQRPQMVHADIISQADTFVFFRCWERDYEYFSRVWRIDLSKFYNHLLQPYRYVVLRGGQFYVS